MSLHAYHYSQKLAQIDAPFDALIFAAMRKADSDNIERLKRAFPDEWEELRMRYNAPLGAIPSDQIDDMDHLAKRIEEFRRQSL